MTYRLTVEEGPYLTLYRGEADDFDALIEKARDDVPELLQRRNALLVVWNDNRVDLDDDGLTDEERERLEEGLSP